MPLADRGGWPAVLSALLQGQDIDHDVASDAMADILAGTATEAQIAAFAVALRMKGETVEELLGVLAAMRSASEVVPVDAERLRLVDTSGTGGDRSHSINVSTLAALVVAGAGGHVAKHGNRSASSQCGSADLLEALGVDIELGPHGVAACIEQAGIGFCFAQRFHPAMRHAAGPRRQLGVATLFNFLGPMSNPARVQRQVIGVADPVMAERMAVVLQRSGAVRAMIVHGDDGLDELSIGSRSTVVDVIGDEVRTWTIEPADVGVDAAPLDAVRGGDVDTNVHLTRRVLDGELGPHRDFVVLNAAAALVVADLADDMAGGVELARATIDDGAAAAALDQLVETSAAVG